MIEFFTTYKEVIGGLASIASILSLLLAGAALIFTGVQIRQNSRTNMAQTLYETQRDGREAVRRLLDNKELAEDLFNREITVPERVLVEVGGVFNIYLAAYHRRRLGRLDDRGWQPIVSDLSGFLGYPRAQEFWRRKQDKSQYDPGFVKLVDQLIAQALSNSTEHSSHQSEESNGGKQSDSI